MSRSLTPIIVCLTACLSIGCNGSEGTVLTISGSTVGDEGRVLATQIERFRRLHPDAEIRIQATPDDATQRHQLYVQWLNARVGKPDVLQLDVIWTPEFAAAGWILPLDGFTIEEKDFFPATIEANRWQGRLHAVPWFVDVGTLYWRSDLIDDAPESFQSLVDRSQSAIAAGDVPYGIVWQGARYEGLVTVFLEYLGGFGGVILRDDGSVGVDEPAGVTALELMRDQIHRYEIAPREVVTWHEEETRFAFQNGRSLFMRNWPYARSLLADEERSRVAGRFEIAPMPASSAGSPTAALGGSQLAINAWSDQPELAWELIEFLTAPEQMLERARVVGQYPARRSLYDDDRLDRILGTSGSAVARIIEAATPRPVTPIYSQLSEILQVQLHRSLVGQSEPREALSSAAAEMELVIERAGLSNREGAGR